jgi:hypothetical protein
MAEEARLSIEIFKYSCSGQNHGFVHSDQYGDEKYGATFIKCPA